MSLYYFSLSPKKIPSVIQMNVSCCWEEAWRKPAGLSLKIPFEGMLGEQVPLLLTKIRGKCSKYVSMGRRYSSFSYSVESVRESEMTQGPGQH